MSMKGSGPKNIKNLFLGVKQARGPPGPSVCPESHNFHTWIFLSQDCRKRDSQTLPGGGAHSKE